MAIRYKTTTMNGKPIQTHRKVWIQNHGEIPDGFCVHHINEDKFDNRIENLELMSSADHLRLHMKDVPVWNKGAEYGKTEGYKLSNSVRKLNYMRVVAKIMHEYDKGTTIRELSVNYSKSLRQIQHMRAQRGVILDVRCKPVARENALRNLDTNA